MFFGVNDVNVVAEEWEDDVEGLLDGIFVTYRSVVEEVSLMAFSYGDVAEDLSSFTRMVLAISCSSICRRWIDRPPEMKP